MEEAEVWKDVVGYSRYLVSNQGRIKDKTTGELRPQTLNGGFWCTNLIRDDGRKELSKVHRLVAVAFVPNPENSYFVGQYGDKLDTSAKNQYWKVKAIKPEKVIETIEHLGETYNFDDFVLMCKTDSRTVRKRLRTGWSTLECVLGWMSYKGEGYTDEFYWYPPQRTNI